MLDFNLCVGSRTGSWLKLLEVSIFPSISITTEALSGYCIAGIRWLKIWLQTFSTDNSIPILRRISWRQVISFRRSRSSDSLRPKSTEYCSAFSLAFCASRSEFISFRMNQFNNSISAIISPARYKMIIFNSSATGLNNSASSSFRIMPIPVASSGA